MVMVQLGQESSTRAVADKLDTHASSCPHEYVKNIDMPAVLLWCLGQFFGVANEIFRINVLFLELVWVQNMLGNI